MVLNLKVVLMIFICGIFKQMLNTSARVYLQLSVQQP